MKRNLLKWMLLFPSLLIAKQEPGDLLKEALKNKSEKVNTESRLIDTLWSYIYYPEGIDTTLKVFNFWNEENGKPIGFVSYKIKKGVKYYEQKIDASLEKIINIKKYTEYKSDWDSLAGMWFLKTKLESIKDLTSQHDTNIYYIVENGNFVPNTKHGNYFTDDSLISSSYYWNKTTHNWDPGYRDIVTKNSKGKNLSSVFLQWNKDSNDFVGISKQNWVYDSKGITVSDISYDFNIKKGIWAVSNSAVCIETPVNGAYKMRYEIYNAETLTFKSAGLKEYLFDNVGNITKEKISSYDSTKKQYVEGYRNEYTYDTQNRLVTFLDQLVENGEVIQTKRTDYAYNPNGNKILEAEIVWDRYTSFKKSKREYLYDAYGNILEMKYYHMISSEKEWPLSLIEKSTYSVHVLGLAEEQLSSRQLFYPNPVSEAVSYALPQKVHYTIYDVNGQFLFSGYDQSIDMTTLATGMYVLRFGSQGQFYTQKIVKE